MARKAKSRRAGAKRPSGKGRASPARRKNPGRKSPLRRAIKAKAASRKVQKSAARKARKPAPRAAAKSKSAPAKKAQPAPRARLWANEGEGSTSADKTYRDAATRFTDTHDTAAIAERAAREVDANPHEYDDAENEGLSHSAGDLPQDEN
jgi:hypothetical protein